MSITSITFTNCLAEFRTNLTLAAQYAFHGTIWKPDPDGIYITKQGCKKVCGAQPELHDWNDSSQAITTWVLPMLGMLLSAPFVSNEFRNTMRATFRWTGSSIMSLKQVFCSLELNSNCCRWLDMSVNFQEYPGQDSRFGKMRDSLYLLSLLNQYTFDGKTEEDMRVLRIALFSDVPSPNQDKSLADMRFELAKVLRDTRQRGVVAALISSFWFLFGVGITIEAGKGNSEVIIAVHILTIVAAYTDLGKNLVAHNMALSFLLTWFPILVLLSIIDASPAGCLDIVEPFNNIIRACRLQLHDAKFRTDLAKDCDVTVTHFTFNPSSLSSTESMFQNFAGQGRQRWFRGAAPSIMADTEEYYIADAGRGWLLREQKAMEALLLPPARQRRSAFYLDAFGQGIAAFVIVVGCAASAILISYYTATVGLGCETSSYIIFVSLTVALALFETCIWNMTDSQNTSVRAWAGGTLAFGEAINTIWAIFVSFAQTLGLYESCECKANYWGLPGTYIDMSHQEQTPRDEILVYWLTGTILASFILATGCAFMVDHWCATSHLSTSNYEKALHGLRRTRKYLRLTSCFRFGPEKFTILFRKVLSLLTLGKLRRKHLRWTVKTKSKRSMGIALRLHRGTHERVMSNADSVLSP